MELTTEALAEKSVWLKVDFLNSPISIRVESMEASGIWCQSSDVVNQVIQDSHKPSKLFAGAAVFVPIERVQYLLAVNPPDATP